MIVYEIGQPYPHKDYRPGHEEIRAVTDHAFFHVVYYCTQPEADGPAWQSGPLRYGLHVVEDIPFLVFHLTSMGMAFEVTINVHTLADDVVDGWLNGERNLVPMLMMDARTNLIRAMRQLYLKPPLAARLRDCLEKQDARYENAGAVEEATDRILARLSTRQLLETTTMHRA